jgi:hypothetical protein
MKEADAIKVEVLVKTGAIEVRRSGDTLTVTQPGKPERELADEAIPALLAHIASLEKTRDKLVNEVAYLKQDNFTAWERHAMATRIGAGTADMLLDAKQRLRTQDAALASA